MASVAESEEIINLVENLPDLDNHIKNTLMPGMNIKRNRNRMLTAAEVNQRLYSTEKNKPGEIIEFAIALANSKDVFTPDLALEIADLIYYNSQPNVKPIPSLDTLLFILLGVEYATRSREFCIIKYETRLRHGNEENHKKIEHEVIKIYLDKLAHNDPYFDQTGSRY